MGPMGQAVVDGLLARVTELEHCEHDQHGFAYWITHRRTPLGLTTLGSDPPVSGPGRQGRSGSRVQVSPIVPVTGRNIWFGLAVLCWPGRSPGLWGRRRNRGG
jgi:hypothetical protein